MTIINELDPLLVSKIAAGEVVERPGNVVKELVENSIDAESTEITVEISNGGKDLIEITDNGKGMSKEDCVISIRRHTTSKINCENDLANIRTLGFRGEALYSIASVSRFSIKTQQNNNLGTLLSCEGDIRNFDTKEISLGKSGTIITIRDLFYNFPVRRKFMKSNISEKNVIKKIMIRYAISFPEISFTFIVDGKTDFATYKSDQHFLPIRQIYGKEFSNKLIDIGIHGEDNISLYGFVSKPGNHSHNRNYQNLYLNNRWISSSALSYAVTLGFKPYIGKGEYPIFFLFLEIEPSEFDVNIHPTKKEVLFHKEEELVRFIRKSISAVINIEKSKTKSLFEFTTPIKEKNKVKGKFERPLSDRIASQSNQVPKLHTKQKAKELDIFSSQKFIQTKETEVSLELSLFPSEITVIGHLGDHFILLEDRILHDLIIVDFHAAHERVNLEKITKDYKNTQRKTQTLLKPLTIDISIYTNFNVIFDKLKLLNKIGFDIRLPKDKKAILVKSIPNLYVNLDIKAVIEHLLDNNADEEIKEIDDLLNSMACRSSYMAGDTLNMRQITDLLKNLSFTKNPTICAHGRPTFIRVPYSDFLKQVKRI